MQLLTTLAFLAATVAAIPTEPQSNEMSFVVVSAVLPTNTKRCLSSLSETPY